MTCWKLTHKHKNRYRDDEIPYHFDDFICDLGGIELTPYQSEFAKDDWAVALHANKTGLTTSELLRDFHAMLLPKYVGHVCLFQSSSQKMADYLLFNLIHKIKKSHKYRKFLNFSYPEGDRLILLNPWRNGNSIISACGPSLKSNYDDDRMNIIRIHLSDPTSMKVNAQDSYFAELVSRLSNINGQLKIEGMPGETRTGWFWKLCRALFQEDHKVEKKTNSSLTTSSHPR